MSDEDKQFIENIIRMNLLAFSSIIPDFEVIYLSHGIHQYLGVLQDIYTDDIDIQERTKSLPENSDTFYKVQIDGKGTILDDYRSGDKGKIRGTFETEREKYFKSEIEIHRQMVEGIIRKDEGAVVLMDRVRRKSRGRVLREIFF